LESDAVKLMTELQRKLGRNVLQFQAIEFELKVVMPYIHPAAHAEGLPGFKAMLDDLSDKPLGVIIEKYKESVETDQPDLLAQELKRVLDARNELIHHFFYLPSVDLRTLDGIREAIRYLDEQFQSLEGTYRVIHSMSAAVMLRVLSSPGYEDLNVAQYRDELLTAIGPNVEIVNVGDPTRTVWETTRIAQLLKLAERETEPFDGMTLLARAGQFIREHAPELSPKTYGLKRLTDVLLASGLFDVDMRANDDNGSVTVLYRSRDSASHASATTDDQHT
jgi:hypothetical protein